MSSGKIDFDGMMQSITKMVQNAQRIQKQFVSQKKALANFEKFQKSIQASQAIIQPLLDAWKFEEEFEAKLSGAGWLPHYTTPIEQLSDISDRDEIQKILSTFYSDKWPEVERQFLNRVSKYDLDDEMKAAFREALGCHGAGYYRSTVRTLFPEIERVFRKEFFGGKVKNIASLEELAAASKTLYLGEVTAFPHGYKLYKKYHDHLYTRVQFDADIPKFQADAVPNRHASVHGIVTYSTMNNSLNMLIMADFIFHLISLTKPGSSP